MTNELDAGRAIEILEDDELEQENAAMGEQSKIDAERAAFEEWYTQKAKTLPLDLGSDPIRYPGGQYVNDFALFGWMAWNARASLPVGVPDGYALVPVEPTTKMYMAGAEAYDKHLPFVYGNVTHVFKAMLAAAPTVKAEQVQANAEWVMRLLDTGEWCLTRFRNDPSMTEDYCRRNSWQVERQCAPYCGDNEVTFWRAETAEQAFTAAINDLFPGRAAEFGRPAPSLPAAGSAVEEVEVVGYRFFHVDHGYIFRRTHIYEGNPSLEAQSLMTAAQHKRIVAALSAQQSAPERVSVSAKFLGDIGILLDFIGNHPTKQEYATEHAVKLRDDLRAILASHAEGGKV